MDSTCDEVNQLAATVASLAAVVNQADRATAASLGVGSIDDLYVLRLLMTQGPLRVGELANRSASSTTTASGRVTRLEKRGLVERRRIAGDLRAMVVELTDVGTETATKSWDRNRRSLESIAPGFPLGVLDDLIEAMADGIDLEAAT